MMKELSIYLTGLATMFYGMMALYFVRKGGMLSRLVALLMTTMSLQCVKDMIFILNGKYMLDYYWDVMTVVDAVAVPMYAFILMELVRPGSVSSKTILLHEIPFVAFAAVFIISRVRWIYLLQIAVTSIYGTFYLIWAAVSIPKYNRRLKKRFSYMENINLNWLKTILYSFYVELALWVVIGSWVEIDLEFLFMILSMGLWMVIDWFLYKHESVLGELETVPESVSETAPPDVEPSELHLRIERLFNERQIFLNPHLRVSDVAAEVGSNRTYVSNYFNREAGTTFYDYVNDRRIGYAMNLLKTTQESVKNIAYRSGFNSPQNFIRVFIKSNGMSPGEFRRKCCSSDKG